MKTLLTSIIFIGAILFMAMLSCKKAVVAKCDGTASTYNFNMKTLINSNCTNSSCHPNYATYNGIKSILTNGSFKSHVVTNKDMPRGSSLSTADLNQIQCWIDAGYPEN
jgi:hypothetical protein